MMKIPGTIQKFYKCEKRNWCNLKGALCIYACEKGILDKDIFEDVE